MTRFFAQWSGRVQLSAFLLVATLGEIATAGDPDPFACDSVGEHGTQISWVDKATEASMQAQEEGKLLMVMQISGDFTQPTFT